MLLNSTAPDDTLFQDTTADDGLSYFDTFTVVVFITVSPVTAILTSVAITVLHKCKRLPFQLKMLSYNVLIADLLVHIYTFIDGIGVAVFGKPFLDMIFYISMFVVLTLLWVSQASIAALTLDRLLAVKNTMNYISLVNRRNVTLVSLYVWLVHTVIPICSFIIPFKVVCNWNYFQPSCDKRLLFLPISFLTMVIFILYSSFIVYAYVQIRKVLHAHMSKIRQHFVVSSIEQNSALHAYRDESALKTKSIIGVVLTFEVTILMISVTNLGLSFIPLLKTREFQGVIGATGFLCYCGYTYVSIYLYVWKMKECRYVFLKTFMTWNKTCAQIADSLKEDIFNIVTKSKQSSNGGTNAPA